jgi:RNA polymerase sigma-70 factor, ECF subfamily
LITQINLPRHVICPAKQPDLRSTGARKQFPAGLFAQTDRQQRRSGRPLPGNGGAHHHQFGTNFKAWAVTIMRNIFINNYRKKVRRNLIVDQTPNAYYINSGSDNVNNDGERQVEFGELMKLVDTLPEDFREPFLMAYEGFKYEEIAEELGSPLGTIKSRIFFARKKLQKLYEENYRERA